MSESALQIIARGPRAAAEAAAAAIDADLQLEGATYSILEEDEDRGIWRIDAYPVSAEEAAGVEARLRAEPGLEVTVEDLADADWLAMALSGLPPVRAGRFFVFGLHDKGKAPAETINLRIEAQTRHLIDDAAAVLGKTRTEFMIDSARAQAIDVLLDQRVASGIGNVYKSEVLFECRVHPRTRMRDVPEAKLTELFERAAHLMRLNLLTRRRTSVPLRRRATPSSQRLWVYMRNGKPCLDCGTGIERFMQGDMNRSTYFCPQCQAAVPC